MVVVATGCTDETVRLVESEFPGRERSMCETAVLPTPTTCAASPVDADGSSCSTPTPRSSRARSRISSTARLTPDVGLVGVRQLTADGERLSDDRRFPNAMRSLFEALGSERFPFRASWLGERELDLERLRTRRRLRLDKRLVHAHPAGGASERRSHGRAVLPLLRGDRPLPPHQAGGLGDSPRPVPQDPAPRGQRGWNPRLDAQAAFAKRQYFEKHLPPVHRLSATAALLLGYALRSFSAAAIQERQESARAALTTLLGLRPPPFGEPPRVALAYDPKL